MRGNALSQERKQQIAREFNFSETVFLHDAEPGQPRKLDIFTTTEELNFAGHPVIGTAHYIFMYLERQQSSFKPNGRQSTTILTKAGIIPIHFNPYRQVAAAEVPYNVHIHSKETPKARVLACQPSLKSMPDAAKMKESYPAVSIVKGMTFTLVDLTDTPSLMAALKVGEAPQPDLDKDWAPSFGGCIYYAQLPADDKEQPPIHKLHVRMIAIGLEDPATGSGNCALSAYLALQKGGKNAKHVFAVEQGVEMGRKSQLCVEIDLNEDGTSVAGVNLSGRATFIAEGRLLSTY